MPNQSDAEAQAQANRAGSFALAGKLVRDQRLLFLAVGGANTVIGFSFYVFYLRVVGLPYVVALALAWICATLVAFGLHRTFVFRVSGHVFRDLWRFVSVNIGAFLINIALLPVVVEFITSNPLVAQFEITAVTVVLSFFAHRDFSFRRKKHQDPLEP